MRTRWFALGSSLLLLTRVFGAAVADAAEPRTFPMSLREVATDLHAHGLGLLLPPDAVGAIDWVFDTRFLVLRTGGREVWIGHPEHPTKTACTLDQLVAKAQDERGYVAMVRKSSEALRPIVAYSVRDAGVESFQVEGCVPQSRALCGAPDLPDEKAVDAVFALCGTLRDQPPEVSLETRLGVYSTVFPDSSAVDRAAGRGGSGKLVRASLELRKVADKFEAVYSVAVVGNPPSATATLNEVKLTYDTFSAAPIAIKSAWPLYLPAHFDGLFVEPGVLTLAGKRYERAPVKPPSRR